MFNSPSRWLRQEYKTNKDKFEKPFKITIEHQTSTGTKTDLLLQQNYQGLGCTVWDGSIALAKMFENDSQLTKNLKQMDVLELGAGCGLVGLTLAHLGAKHVLLTDMELCLPILKRNVDKNTKNVMTDNIRVLPYVWGEDTTVLTKFRGKFDLLVAAEVLYDERDSMFLAQSAMQLLAEGGVMFVSMGRNRNGETAFTDVMTENGYTVVEVSPVILYLPGYQSTKFKLSKENMHPQYQDEIIKIIRIAKER